MKKNILWVAVVAIVAALSFTSCSDNSPSGVVKSYFGALKKGKVEKAVEYLNIPESRKESKISSLEFVLKTNKATRELWEKGEVKIESEEIEGDEALLEVSLTIDGAGMSLPIKLTKVDGEWKIDN